MTAEQVRARIAKLPKGLRVAAEQLSEVLAAERRKLAGRTTFKLGPMRRATDQTPRRDPLDWFPGSLVGRGDVFGGVEGNRRLRGHVTKWGTAVAAPKKPEWLQPVLPSQLPYIFCMGPQQWSRWLKKRQREK